jgi:hypothetical protein
VFQLANLGVRKSGRNKQLSASTLSASFAAFPSHQQISKANGEFLGHLNLSQVLEMTP